MRGKMTVLLDSPEEISMSETVAYEGKLVPVDREGKSLDLWIQERLGWSDLRGHSNWLEALEETIYGGYFYDSSKAVLYEVQRRELHPEDFIHATANADGSFDFVVGYYNGGASFEEVMGSVVEN